MMHFKGIFVLVLCLGSINISKSTENNIRSFLKNSETFSKAFYKEVLKDPKLNGKSFVYSPFSIQMAGALLYAGADGETAKEIFNGFQFTSEDPKELGVLFDKSIEKSNPENKLFKIANKVYIQNSYSLAPNYKDIITEYFKSEIENINFDNNVEAAKQINTWVEEKTNEKIKNFISPETLGLDMRLFLLNAIHFKGFWIELFDKNQTRKRDFHTEPDEVVEAEYMVVTSSFNVTFSNDLGLRAIDIPFKDSDLSLFLVSPALTNLSLSTLEEKLNTIDLKKDLFDTTSRFKIHARIPKFKIESDINLEDSLKNLGMEKMFGYDANFSKFLETPEPLTLSKAIHKAVIEVNEEGAEAAAVTAHGIRRKSGPLIFVMDQSFIYFIKNGEGQIYFMGRFTGV